MTRLTLSFIIVISIAGLSMARGADERLRIADSASDPGAYSGRTVEVKARVVAINADDGQSIELFDSYARL